MYAYYSKYAHFWAPAQVGHSDFIRTSAIGTLRRCPQHHGHACEDRETEAT